MKRTILNIMLCLSVTLVSGSLVNSQTNEVSAYENPTIQPLDLPWQW